MVIDRTSEVSRSFLNGDHKGAAGGPKMETPGEVASRPLLRIALTAVHFGDDRRVGALRARALAERLAERGHKVAVFTAEQSEAHKQPAPSGVHVHELRHWRGQPEVPRWFSRVLRTWRRADETTAEFEHRSAPSKPGEDSTGSRSVSRGTLRLIREVSFLAYDVLWGARAAVQEHRSSPAKQTFDVILSTYGPLSSLMLGFALKISKPRAAWVVDFRDSLPQESQSRAVRRVFLAVERWAASGADLITVVSKGVREEMASRLEGSAPPMLTLTNSFDERQLGSPRTDSDVAAEIERGAPPVLKLVYAGSLYGGRRDLSPLLQAMGQVQRGRGSEPMIELHYAGNEGALLKALAEDHSVESAVVDHGFLGREESLALQRQADVLVVATWNTEAEKGILTGKFFEYLGASRPILALVSGQAPNSELAELVRKGRFGEVWEEADREASDEKLRTALSRALDFKEKGRAVPYDPDPALKCRHSANEVVARLEFALLELCPSPSLPRRQT